MPPKTPDLYADTPSSLRLALCQIETEPWAVGDNLQRTLEALEQASAMGAELAITPECALHGYADANGPEDFERLRQIAEPIDGANLRAIREKTRALQLDAVVGFCERGEGGKIHNSAALISRTGEIADIYRKVHCRPFESSSHQGLFTSGDRFFAHALNYEKRSFKVGLMICFDREIPESVRCLRAVGAQLIACPLATNTYPLHELAEEADNELITRCRAAENEVFIAVVNHAVRFNGGSFVVGPGGQKIIQLGAAPEVCVIDLPVGSAAEKFHSQPLGWMGWGYRRPEVYGKYLS